MITFTSTHSWRDVPDPEHRHDEPVHPVVRQDDSWIGLRSLHNLMRNDEELARYHQSFTDWRRRKTSCKLRRIKNAIDTGC